MSAPRRWVEDPDADEQLQRVLRGAPSARPLDAVTRRRLGAKVARVSALPLVAAGWLFVKSAAAALGMVLGAGAIAVSTGVIEWGPPAPAPLGPQPSLQQRKAPSSVPVVQAAPSEAPPVEEPAAPIAASPSQLNPTPTLPVASAGPGGLSAEAALLESARAQLRRSPAQALALAAQHVARFPDGQLAAERTLIQIEALHRSGRDPEARTLARGLLGGAGADMYAERVRQLLGDSSAR
jgi:hypothetical protein